MEQPTRRRLSTRALAALTVALWIVALIVVTIVLLLWWTSPLQPIELG